MGASFDESKSSFNSALARLVRPSQWNVWRLTVFLGRCNWRDQQRLAVSYFSEYSTDFSVSNSGHEVLRRTVKDGKTGFEKRTVASSVCCFVGARVNVRKPVKGEREPLTEAGLVKE